MPKMRYFHSWTCLPITPRTMFTATTHGITVSVEVRYEPEHSNPALYKYVFSYQVLIENNSDQTVQLLRRHWHIIDGKGLHREVEGEGVVGQQPVLRPGQSHHYASWCPLRTPIGKMYGTYLMVRQRDHRLFMVRIPEFRLEAPQILN